MESSLSNVAVALRVTKLEGMGPMGQMGRMGLMNLLSLIGPIGPISPIAFQTIESPRQPTFPENDRRHQTSHGRSSTGIAEKMSAAVDALCRG
jgi:hypothetical protein